MTDMATDGEIDRALAAVTATINDQQLEQFDRERVQEIVTQALGGEPLLKVDDRGGLHDRSGSAWEPSAGRPAVSGSPNVRTRP